jgi:hypothetical protein
MHRCYYVAEAFLRANSEKIYNYVNSLFVILVVPVVFNLLYMFFTDSSLILYICIVNGAILIRCCLDNESLLIHFLNLFVLEMILFKEFTISHQIC